MKLIAHRGLFNGPDPNLENMPDQILKSLSLGYDCEIDLWKLDNDLFLGHDLAQYEITSNFLKQDGLWIHAKNLSALLWLTETNLNFFWHQNDDFIITSKNYIWTSPNKKLTNKSIAVMPEWHDPQFINLPTDCFAICSDYVDLIRKKLNGFYRS